MQKQTELTKRLAEARRERYNGTVSAFVRFEHMSKKELQKVDATATKLNVKGDL